MSDGKIKKIRKKKNITQKKLAQMANISLSWLKKVKSKNPMPSVRLLAKIARILGVKLCELLNIKE